MAADSEAVAKTTVHDDFDVDDCVDDLFDLIVQVHKRPRLNDADDDNNCGPTPLSPVNVMDDDAFFPLGL